MIIEHLMEKKNIIENNEKTKKLTNEYVFKTKTMLLLYQIQYRAQASTSKKSSKKILYKENFRI